MFLSLKLQIISLHYMIFAVKSINSKAFLTQAEVARVVWTAEEEVTVWLRPEIQQKMQLLWNLCVWCRSHAVLRRMLLYLDILLQYVEEESGKIFWKIHKRAQIVLSIRKSVWVISFSFFDTICGIFCLLPNYYAHLQLFVCFCVFSASPSLFAPPPSPCSTLQQL